MSRSLLPPLPSFRRFALPALALGASVVTTLGCTSLAGRAAPAPCAEEGGADCAVPARYAVGKCETPDDAMPEASSEDYTDYGVRGFVDAREDNLSTFATDVDTGSYTLVRRKLREGTLPPAAAVRVEEFVNYFRQEYASPPAEETFAVRCDATQSPFRSDKVLLRIGLQGQRLARKTRKRANLVFLVDTSGSMQSPDKIGLLKQSLAILVGNLRGDDRVSICTYAGSVTKVLDPTPARERGTILRALSRLRAGGSTAMASGIDLAYRLAAAQAGPGVNTRVIVCSDGDANVGPSSHQGILKLIEEHRDRGITLGTVGFGMGNYKDTMMEQLADKGNGSYAYVDTRAEAERLFGEDLLGSLETIAFDVKLQVAFDPTRVRRYRLIGYENRAIADEDFRRDPVDAGEVGAGHSVTALYELELREPGGSLGEVRLRYKSGEVGPSAEACERHFPLSPKVHSRFESAPQRLRFMACVAEFAEVLRGSPHAETPLAEIARRAEASLDPAHDDREHDFLASLQRAVFLRSLGG